MPRSTGATLDTRQAPSGSRAPAGRERSALEIRTLSYTDLPHVIELSKPASVCIGAFRDGGLVGYLVCSRYHTVWHLMNVAVDPDHRRAGIASSMIEYLFRVTGDRERYTLEVRVSNAEAIRMYESY